jgi:hypothetical protein
VRLKSFASRNARAQGDKQLVDPEALQVTTPKNQRSLAGLARFLIADF